MDKIQRVLKFCRTVNSISKMDQDVTVFVICSLYGQQTCDCENYLKVFISYLGENINLNSLSLLSP